MRTLMWLLVLVGCSDGPLPELRVGTACPKTVILELDDHWIATHPFYGDVDWKRATYFIGHMAAAETLDDQSYFDYATAWAEQARYQLNDGVTTRNADNHAAGQVYLELYDRAPDPSKIADIKRSVDLVIGSGERTDWSWIDAQFMASPTYAHLGEITGDPKYQRAMFELYVDARDRRHLFDASEGLWFRDENYVGAKTKNGKKVLWARGNGWVIASLARTLEHLAPDSEYRPAYEEMLRAMAEALRRTQNETGLWGVSLADPDDYPGPEASGTGFFTYGLAWGVNHGVLDRDTYAPIIERAWRGLVDHTMRADGELGYVQGVGEAPGSSQPVTLRDTHDYGLGAVLLAASEVSRVGLQLCP